MAKIDKQVPLPKKRRNEYKFPFADLKVGDSFYAANTNRNIVYSSFYYYNANVAKVRIKITTRTEGKGVRVWRIADKK